MNINIELTDTQIAAFSIFNLAVNPKGDVQDADFVTSRVQDYLDGVVRDQQVKAAVSLTKQILSLSSGDIAIIQATVTAKMPVVQATPPIAATPAKVAPTKVN